jgi:hypothetical protein
VLIDYELAQFLPPDGGPPVSPHYVNDSVRQLYIDRDVPRNSHTLQYVKGLDEHVMDGSLEILRRLLPVAREMQSTGIVEFAIPLPLLGEIRIDIDRIALYFWKRLH